jgi:hypothetical protein
MKYEKPIIEFNEDGSLKKFVVGICDTCNNEIDNSKEGFIEQEGKIFHARPECYKP